MERVVVKGYYMHERREIIRFWLEWMERRLCCLSWVKAVSLAASILSIWLGTSKCLLMKNTFVFAH
jgi:hypothetical protein